MPNQRYHKTQDKITATDKGNGKGGSGKVIDIKKTYGNSQKFGTEYTEEGNKNENLGGKGKFGSC